HVATDAPFFEPLRESLVVPVITPLQLSVAVGGVLIVAVHWPVASGKLPAFGTGAVVSCTTMFCVWGDSLPVPSMKCQVTTKVPCVECVSESVVVPVITPLQLSVAVGGALIVAEHCPVTSGQLAASGTSAVAFCT